MKLKQASWEKNNYLMNEGWFKEREKKGSIVGELGTRVGKEGRGYWPPTKEET